jgi:hypothetical protein
LAEELKRLAFLAGLERDVDGLLIGGAGIRAVPLPDDHVADPNGVLNLGLDHRAESVSDDVAQGFEFSEAVIFLAECAFVLAPLRST